MKCIGTVFTYVCLSFVGAGVNKTDLNDNANHIVDTLLLERVNMSSVMGLTFSTDMIASAEDNAAQLRGIFAALECEVVNNCL